MIGRALSELLDIAVMLLAIVALVTVGADGKFGITAPTDHELLRFAAGAGLANLLITVGRLRK